MSLTSPLKGESLKIILLITLGWTCFSGADAITKYLALSYNPSVIITLGAIVNVIVIALWILWDKGLKGFLTPQWKLFALRALLTGMTSFGIVNALSLIPIADMYGITFSSPFFTVVMAALLLKEHVGWHRWAAVIIGFIGVLILVGPQYGEINTGLTYAIMATFSIALGTIILRKIGTKNVYMPLLVFYSYVGMLTVNLPIALPVLQIIPTPDLYYILVNAALLLTAVSLTTYSLSHSQSTASVAPFIYIQAIWGVVFGYIFFDDLPTVATIFGLFIVVGAGLYMIYRERQLNKMTAG